MNYLFWFALISVAILVGMSFFGKANKEKLDADQENKPNSQEIEKVLKDLEYYQSVNSESYQQALSAFEKFKAILNSSGDDQFMLQDKFERAESALRDAVDAVSSIGSSFISGDSDDIEIVSALAGELAIEGRKMLDDVKLKDNYLGKS